MIWQNAKVRAFGFAWPCTKTFAVNAHPHSPSTARLNIKFISCASTCHASSPLWLYPCMHPATGVPKQKNADFFSAHLYDSGTRMRRFGGCFARCYWRHMLRRPFRCTHPSSTAAFQRKDTNEPLSWKVLFFLSRAAAPQSPCALLAGVVAVLWLL